MLNLHSLKNSIPRKSRKRVGRGEGNNWGRTCGRGEKGQMARSGAVRRPYFEGGQIPLLRRLPKKGFNNPNHKEYAIVNVCELNENYNDGEVVDTNSLVNKGIIGKAKHGVKVLGNGEISKSLTVKVPKMFLFGNKKD